MRYSKIKILKNTTFRFIVMSCVLTVCLFANLSQATAQNKEKYIGFWGPSGGNNQVLQFDNWTAFAEKWAQLRKNNMRLQDLETAKVGNQVKYTGTWTSGTGKDGLFLFNSWADFIAKWKQLLSEKDLQLIDIEVVPNQDKTVYIGVWGAGPGGSALFQYDNWTDFVDKWNELSKSNRVLIDVEAFRQNGKTNYVGVWQAGAGKDQRLYNTGDWEDFTTTFKEVSDDGFRLVDMDLLRVEDDEQYIGVWGKGTGGQYLWVSDTWNDFLAKNKEINAIKLDLIDFAMVSYPKPAPKPPQGKPAQQNVLYFSKGQAMKKDPVTGIDFPADMPAIVFPNFEECNAADRKVAEKAWAMAHHHAWRAYQLFKFLDSTSARDKLWSAGYTAGSNMTLRKQSWSPFAWFGEYSGSRYRFDFIRDAVYMDWQKRFLVKNTIKCRRNDNGLHPCYLKNPGTNDPPSANHIVSGRINLCNRFFDGKNEMDQIRTLLHETYHWLVPKGLAILDTQTHSDKTKNGLCDTNTDKMYGMDNALHLATSSGCWGNEKLHRGMAARNNDNYAYFVLRLGDAIYNKRLTQFPSK